ncbi:hypothetical protein BH09BAC2_BH09BAC2_19180 [soil metagenome]
MSLHTYMLINVKRLLGILAVLFLLHPVVHAADTVRISTKQQALAYLEQLPSLNKSTYWKNIDPNIFLDNIVANIKAPTTLYEGSNTNFCGYAAIAYLALEYDPLAYAKFITSLYNDGRAPYGKSYFIPSAPVRRATGTLKYKGQLDIHPADQMLFMSLADHFKSYINFFNRKYDSGDENNFWSSCTYHKFNKMVKTLFPFQVHAKGSDLFHPAISDLFTYLQMQQASGVTILYLNNTFLYKKNHNQLKPGIPTHYVALYDIKKDNDEIVITYWDYGFKTTRKISPSFLRKIIFGVTHCTINANHVP